MTNLRLRPLKHGMVRELDGGNPAGNLYYLDGRGLSLRVRQILGRRSPSLTFPLRNPAVFERQPVSFEAQAFCGKAHCGFVILNAPHLHHQYR